MADPRYMIEAVDEAVRIMGILAKRTTPASAEEIARLMNITRNKAFRILYTLEQSQCVDRMGDGYRLGGGLADLWARYRSRLQAEIDVAKNKLMKLEVVDNA